MYRVFEILVSWFLRVILHPRIADLLFQFIYLQRVQWNARIIKLYSFELSGEDYLFNWTLSLLTVSFLAKQEKNIWKFENKLQNLRGNFVHDKSPSAQKCESTRKPWHWTLMHPVWVRRVKGSLSAKKEGNIPKSRASHDWSIISDARIVLWRSCRRKCSMGILRWRDRFGSVGTIQTHTRARVRAYALPPDHRPPVPRPESVLQRGIGFHLNKVTHSIDGNLQLRYF